MKQASIPLQDILLICNTADFLQKNVHLIERAS